MLNSRWDNFNRRGQSWDSFWQDGPEAASPAVVNSDTGVISLNGFAPSVVISDNKIVSTGVGAISLTGHAPEVVVTNIIFPGTGALTLTGYAPTISISSPPAPGGSGSYKRKLIKGRRVIGRWR